MGHPDLLNEWQVGRPLLEITEQSTVQASDELVRAISDELWDALKLVVQRKPGDRSWTVRASDFAGVARVDVEGQSTHIRVAPKIGGLDLFFLADWAFGSSQAGRKLHGHRASLAALRSEPAACLLGWYVAEVLAFATRWLRRGYVPRDEDLVGRVKGRIDFSRYISHSLAKGRPHVVPSRFAEPSHDTAENRYLKAGLRHAAVLARSVPLEGARLALGELIRRALALFSGVADIPARAEGARRLRLNGPMRHYSGVVDFTTALIEGTYVSTDAGAHTQDAIMWSLNGLYEAALANVLGEWPGATILRPVHNAMLVTPDGAANGKTPVRPDYVALRADGVRVVLDAKYKSVVSSPRLSPEDDSVVVSPIDGQRVRVRRADIYQVVAYARHSELRTDRVALLYPIALGEFDPYPKPLRVTGFHPVCHVVFFDVGQFADRSRGDLYDALDGL